MKCRFTFKAVWSLLGLFALACVIAPTLAAQYESVFFDAEKNYFNQNQPLPADQYFMITGFVPDSTVLIRATIDRPARRRSNDLPLYEGVWKRTPNYQSAIYEVPINFALLGNRYYNLEIGYYSPAPAALTDSLLAEAVRLLDRVLADNTNMIGRRLNFELPPSEVIALFDQSVRNLAGDYLNKRSLIFPGFGIDVRDALSALNKTKTKNEDTIDELRRDVRRQLRVELNRYFNEDLLQPDTVFYLPRYPVEATPKTIAINAGYGMTLGRRYASFPDQSNPYVGVSLPLSNRQYTSAFLKNTAISLGISLRNYTDEDKNVVSGPIVRRPLYAALGYRFFNFFRLNAGLHLLSTDVDGEAQVLENLNVEPFIGLSAEFSIWVGVGARKRLPRR